MISLVNVVYKEKKNMTRQQGRDDKDELSEK
jgi:hypothetical protein